MPTAGDNATHTQHHTLCVAASNSCPKHEHTKEDHGQKLDADVMGIALEARKDQRLQQHTIERRRRLRFDGLRRARGWSAGRLAPHCCWTVMSERL